MRAVEAILADRIYNRIISEGLYRPDWRSAYYRPYYPSYTAYLSPSLSYEINRLLDYHDYIDRYGVVNHVLSYTLDPRLAEIIGVMHDVINKPKAGAAATPAATAPAAKTLLQTKAEGVPVYVDPALQPNTMGDADLSQRGYIIDGVDGIAFVQTEAQVNAKNPVENPPFNNWSVNQPSPPHAQGLTGYEDLALRDLTIDGVNGFALAQTGSEMLAQTDAQMSNPVENPPFNNWSVNQPSPPHAQGLTGYEDLALRDLTIDGVNGFALAQTGSEMLAQTESQMSNPVENPPFNNWSVNQPSPPHASGLTGYEDLGLRDLLIDGVNGYALSQTEQDLRQGNPVENPPFNNWSVNQPSPPHAQGMVGKENLGLTLKVTGHIVSVAQQTNPVENPPFNNWSVNQPSPPHAQGMQGKENLGLTLNVRGHVLNIAQQSSQNPVENPPFNNWSVHQLSSPHDDGMQGKEELTLDEMVVSESPIHIAQKHAKQQKSKTSGLDLSVSGDPVHLDDVFN